MLKKLCERERERERERGRDGEREREREREGGTERKRERVSSILLDMVRRGCVFVGLFLKNNLFSLWAGLKTYLSLLSINMV